MRLSVRRVKTIKWWRGFCSGLVAAAAGRRSGVSLAPGQGRRGERESGSYDRASWASSWQPGQLGPTTGWWESQCAGVVGPVMWGPPPPPSLQSPYSAREWLLSLVGPNQTPLAALRNMSMYTSLETRYTPQLLKDIGSQYMNDPHHTSFVCVCIYMYGPHQVCVSLYWLIYMWVWNLVLCILLYYPPHICWYWSPVNEEYQCWLQPVALAKIALKVPPWW